MPEESGSEERRREPSRKRKRRRREPEPIVRRSADDPGAARLYALLAGAGLTLLGIVGFFYDAGFGTGSALDGDDVAGILIVNGWRNVIYLVSGLLALTFAAARPRAVALGIGAIYLVLGIAGAANTNADIGSLFDALPLTDEDNVFHVAVGAIGLIAFVADGALPKPALPKRTKRRLRKARRVEPSRKARKSESRAAPQTVDRRA